MKHQLIWNQTGKRKIEENKSVHDSWFMSMKKIREGRNAGMRMRRKESRFCMSTFRIFAYTFSCLDKTRSRSSLYCPMRLRRFPKWAFYLHMSRTNLLAPTPSRRCVYCFLSLLLPSKRPNRSALLRRCGWWRTTLVKRLIYWSSDYCVAGHWKWFQKRSCSKLSGEGTYCAIAGKSSTWKTDAYSGWIQTAICLLTWVGYL